MNDKTRPEEKTTSKHIHVGREGESAALSYLLERGYRLRDRNIRFRRGELDLVMTSPAGEWVFVEVKSAGSDAAGDPAGWVNGRKQLQVQRVAQGYCLERGLREVPMRFDVVAVTWDEAGTPQVKHLENAFLPDLKSYWRSWK